MLLSIPIAAFGYDAKINGIYYNFSGSNATVTYRDYNFNSYSGVVVIPEYVIYDSKIYSVTSIGSFAFKGCRSLTSVTIPNTVTSIGSYAFSNCAKLKSVTIATSVTSIGLGVFDGCGGLTSVTIPNSVTTIGDYAFNSCSGLTSISIPESVTSIGNYAFSDCSGLISITIPQSVTSIGNYVFQNCSGLKSVTIPNSVTSISNFAFSHCSDLTSVVISESVTSIGSSAFLGCSSLTSITIPNSVTSIGNSAFYGCSGLQKVIVPDIAAWCNISFDTNANPLSYVHHLFSDEETEITNLVIPESVTTIGIYAFSGCSSLTSVTISNSVTSIGNDAFSGCSSLTSVTIPNSVTSVGSYAFSGCSGLISATIGNSVTSIGKRAFYGCSGLTSITIPESVTSIKQSAFGGCSGLEKIIVPDIAAWCNITFDTDANPLSNVHHLFSDEETEITNLFIPEGVTKISNYAFSSCSGLASVTIPESVTTIGSYAFKDCSSLISVIIPNSVTNISSDAFSGCYGLLSVTLNNNSLVSASRTTSTSMESIFGSQVEEYVIGGDVTSIGSYAFSNCANLKSVTIANSVTRIGNDAFSECSSLSDITIPNGVISIGSSAFQGCTNLESVTIPNSVNSIEYHAFYRCGRLKKVIVPDIAAWCGIKFRDNFSNPLYYAHHLFRDETTEITELVISEGVTSISFDAFYGCSGLTSVIIPENVTSIGEGAFLNCSGLTSVTLNSNAIVSASRNYNTSMKSKFGDQVKTYVIGNTVKAIGSYAFYGCSGLNNITISDKVTSMGAYAFSGCNNAKLYVNRGTDGLLSVWNYGTDPYEVGTSQILPRPSVSVTSTTQATIKYHINNIYPELEYNCNYDNVVGDNEYLIKGLRPDYNYSVNLVVKSANNTYNATAYSTTLPITPMVISSNVTASSISASGDYIQGDAKVISTLLTVDGKEITGVSGAIHGLEPNTSYNCSYMVVVEYGKGDTYTYADSKSIRTADLTLTTQQPKVISEGNVIVAAQSNLDDEETNVGFEWRRTDWTDDFDSKTGGAYLYEGMMEGYIRSLNSRYLWKFRPFYTSDAGNTYYGDWKGMDPSDYSYFEPTVYTYSSVTVQGNSAEVKGYAMRGTDNVTSQGFMYWSAGSASSRRMANSIPSDAKTILASGNVMTATLENLEYDTHYCYVAFVKTSEGETFYGEQQIFKTNSDPDGIKEIESLTPALSKGEEDWYDLNGRKLAAPQKGIYIIRYSDGTSKKVLVK